MILAQGFFFPQPVKKYPSVFFRFFFYSFLYSPFFFFRLMFFFFFSFPSGPGHSIGLCGPWNWTARFCTDKRVKPSPERRTPWKFFLPSSIHHIRNLYIHIIQRLHKIGAQHIVFFFYSRLKLVSYNSRVDGGF